MNPFEDVDFWLVVVVVVLVLEFIFYLDDKAKDL